VLTFDDITEIAIGPAQGAWADVARRIAHEIKNPLTPIMLSAERLKRKYLKEIAATRNLPHARPTPSSARWATSGAWWTSSPPCAHAAAGDPARESRRGDAGGAGLQTPPTPKSVNSRRQSLIRRRVGPLYSQVDGQALTNLLQNAAATPSPPCPERGGGRPHLARLEAVPEGWAVIVEDDGNACLRRGAGPARRTLCHS
jgi:two-component system nitrogen regulation sensor histidine kinase NtrY